MPRFSENRRRMTQKISRRDMKRNELAETVGQDRRTTSPSTARASTEAVAIVAGRGRDPRRRILPVPRLDRTLGRQDRSPRRSAILETPLASDAAAARRAKTFATAAERRAEADKFLQQGGRPRVDRARARGRAVILAASGAEKPGRVGRQSSRRPPAQGRPRPPPPPRSTRPSCSPPQGKADGGHRPA